MHVVVLVELRPVAQPDLSRVHENVVCGDHPPPGGVRSQADL